MNDTIDIARVTGEIWYIRGIDVNRQISMFVEMRKHIGMVSKRPIAKSIYKKHYLSA